MKRRRIAIIGAGLSGVAVAANLLKRGRAAPDVVLIERRERFGPGLAYKTSDPQHLLNVRARNLSALADQPDHFVRWLAHHGRRDAGTHYVQRKLYGAYAEEVLRTARRGLFGAGVERLHGDVTACQREGGGWRLTLSNGKNIQADAVVLALGNASSTTPDVFARAGVALVDPWDSAALKRLPPGDVLMLGAGLTMVDAVLTLSTWRHKGVFYALSRRGLTARGHLQSPALPEPSVFPLPANLSDALRAFRAEVRAMAARGEPWQHAIDRLRTRTPELWRRLPLDAQKRFLRHLRPWWDVHRHRTAPEVSERIAELQNAGRLRGLAGAVVGAEQSGASVVVHHRQRGSYARHRLEVAGIVNCTGAALDPRASPDPLVMQLLADALVRPHANGLGFDVDGDGRLLDADGAPHADLFALGPITQGAFWECTAVPEIRQRAASIAMTLAPDA